MNLLFQVFFLFPNLTADLSTLYTYFASPPNLFYRGAPLPHSMYLYALRTYLIHPRGPPQVPLIMDFE